MSTTLTRAMARLIFLPTLMTAAAFLIKGYSETGDGFSAGIIAAVGLMLQYVVLDPSEIEHLRLNRLGPAAAFSGLLLLLLIVFLPVVWGDALLAHLPRPDEEVQYIGSLELHTAILFDLGVFLVVVGFAITATRLIANVSARREP